MSAGTWTTIGIALGVVLAYHVLRDRLDAIVPRV